MKPTDIMLEADQEIYIGNEIRIKIIEIGSRNVRFGISAPPSLAVIRKELITGGNLWKPHNTCEKEN